MSGQHAAAPPPEVVSFLNKVFAFADELPEQEGVALRRLVRAGLLAESPTIDTVLNADVSGYASSSPLPSSQVWPGWFWPQTRE